MAGLAWTCLPFPYYLLGSIGFLSVIRACLATQYLARSLNYLLASAVSTFLPFT